MNLSDLHLNTFSLHPRDIALKLRNILGFQLRECMMRMALIVLFLATAAANAHAEERTFRSGDRIYTFDFSADLLFKLREKSMEGFTAWEFRTNDWVVKSERGAALAIHETFEPYDDFLAYWRGIPADERGDIEEGTNFAILYTKEGQFLSMIARSSCEKPCHLFILVGAAPNRKALQADTIARLKKTIEAGDYVKTVD